MTSGSVLVVVPTYNERDNLPVLVGELVRQPGYSVLRRFTSPL